MFTGHNTFRFCKSLFYLSLLALSVLLMTPSCATRSKPSARAHLKSADPQVVHSHVDDSKIEKRLREEYTRWKGTRHRLGGTGSRGIDCSGFVRTVYKDVFNIDLPATTRAQLKQGKPVSFKQLRAGDLVFFQPPTYPRHVGIFLGDCEFVHAYKNRGVTVSKIDPYYWGKYYWTARRILPTDKRP